LLSSLQQLGEDRDEGGGEGRVGEEGADQVGDLEGDREGGEGAAGAEVAGRDDLAHEAGYPGQSGRGREDDRVARPPPATLPLGTRLLGGRFVGGLGRHERAIVRRVAALTVTGYLWPIFIPRRSASFALSVSGRRTVATRRRSRPLSASSRRSSRVRR